nr:hypothetical protein [Sinirhodobacter populi]
MKLADAAVKRIGIIRPRLQPVPLPAAPLDAGAETGHYRMGHILYLRGRAQPDRITDRIAIVIIPPQHEMRVDGGFVEVDDQRFHSGFQLGSDLFCQLAEGLILLFGGQRVEFLSRHMPEGDNPHEHHGRIRFDLPLTSGLLHKSVIWIHFGNR